MGYGYGGDNYSFYILGHQQGSGYAKVQYTVDFYADWSGWSEGAAFWTLNNLNAGDGGGINYVNISNETIVPIEDLGAKQEVSVSAWTKAFPKCIHWPPEIAGCASNEAFLNTRVSITVYSDRGKQLGILSAPPGGGRTEGDPTPVPEPATWGSMAVAVGAIALRKRLPQLKHVSKSERTYL